MAFKVDKESWQKMNLFNFIPGYNTNVFQAGREPALIMLLAFIFTYIVARGYTRIARRTGWGSASYGGVHTHHMVFGMIIAFISGALAFAFNPEPGPFLLFLAAGFGMGAALVLDEFALLFHLEDVYWEKEGRKSIDAIVISLLLGVIFLMQTPPLGTGIEDFGVPFSVAVAINLPFLIIAGLKGKIYFALFGLFIPFIALVGSIRLAKPDSIWAKKFYSGPKRQKSKRRYGSYHAKWSTKKEKIWDIIGGRTGRPLQKKVNKKYYKRTVI